MRTMISDRIYAIVFVSVPALAFWALSPVWTILQARELSPSHAVSVGDVATERNDASAELITDLSDWNYTANPMSPNGKTSFSRRLLSNQPGAHPTPAGPNPRVPWITRPASGGNMNFANVNPGNIAIAAVQGLPTASTPDSNNSQGANSSQATVSSTIQGSVKNGGAPKTEAAFDTAVVMSTLAMLQNMNSTAVQPVVTPAFQPVKSKWQNRAAGMKLGSDAAQ